MTTPSLLSVRSIAALLTVPLFAACGGSGGSPTAPSADPSASIQGQVVAASPTTGDLEFADPLPGVTVAVEGTGIAVSTDGQGRFSLDGVPPGDRMLVFERGGESAAVAIAGVLAAERIDIVVALQGSSARLESIHRGGSGPGAAAVDLEKATNGNDADRPPGSSIPVGNPVEWTYEVANTGGVELTNIVVSDDQGVVVTCPQATLDIGESMTCLGSGVAEPGLYANLGAVVAFDRSGAEVTDSDPSHYTGGVPGASIDIEKSTDGEDADSPPGPTLIVGDPVDWDYVLVNDGSVDLVDLVVTDDQGVLVTCPQTALAVGESITCLGSGTVEEGQYVNLGTVQAVGVDGSSADDEDPSHYFGEIADDGPFTVQIQPKSWNTNWTGSSGTVSAKIENGDLLSIDPATIVLYEADPAVALAPIETPTLTGGHIRAFFAKSAAFALLDTPIPGETRTVHVGFLAAGVAVELPYDIKVVGPAN